MKNHSAKRVQDSQVIMTEMCLPQDTNALGTIFGGKVMALIDIAAAMAAGKHARSSVVTASIDALSFVAPVKLGEYIHIRASVNYVGRTSMEVGVRVDKENPFTGEMKHTATAYLTFVALDSDGHSRAVPELIVQSPEEIRRHSEALKRRASRMKLAEELKSVESN